MADLPSALTKRAQAIMDELIVRDGLSYEDAIRRARKLGYEASKPYLQVAYHLETALKEAKHV